MWSTLMIPVDIVVCKHRHWVEWLAKTYGATLEYNKDQWPIRMTKGDQVVMCFSWADKVSVAGKRVFGAPPYPLAVYCKSIQILEFQVNSDRMPANIRELMIAGAKLSPPYVVQFEGVVVAKTE